MFGLVQMITSVMPSSVDPAHQLTDAELLGPDALEVVDGAAEHVVAALELAGPLDGDDVAGLLDHAQHRLVALTDRSRSCTAGPRRG